MNIANLLNFNGFVSSMKHFTNPLESTEEQPDLTVASSDPLNVQNQKEEKEKEKKESKNENFYEIFEKLSSKITNKGWVVYSLEGKGEIFTDQHDYIKFHSSNTEEEALLATLLFAKEKFHNSFEITGNEEFQKKVMETMIKNQIEVNLSNPIQAKKFQQIKDEINGTQPLTPKENLEEIYGNGFIHRQYPSSMNKKAKKTKKAKAAL